MWKNYDLNISNIYKNILTNVEIFLNVVAKGASLYQIWCFLSKCKSRFKVKTMIVFGLFKILLTWMLEMH